MPRHTTDDARWQVAIADFRRSGLAQPEFCRRRGLTLHTLRRRLYARPAATPSPEAAETIPQAAAPADAPRFVPVTLVPGPSFPTPTAAASDPLVLILDGKLRIAVAPGFDNETLRRLLEALGTRP